ncbi:Bax inhibitor-1, partial [Volvox carteri f. nagariensis]
IQKHLQRVYATLGVALTISALGCLSDLYYSIAGVLTYLTGFGCLMGLTLTSNTPSNLNKRYAMLAGFSFCQGAALGKLVDLAVLVDPSIVLTAFLGTAAVFLSFTLAALLSARRSFLFLGGWLASAVTGLFVLRLSSWLLGAGTLAFQAELYVGLLMFALYVLVDTQLIVEKAGAGYMDPIRAALDLLVDLLAIFARVLVILLNKQAKRERRTRRDDRERR